MASATSLHGLNQSPREKCARTLICFLTPILFSFVLILPKFYSPSGVNASAFAHSLGWVYVLLVTGIYLITNAFTITVVALIPFILMPLFGVVDARTLAGNFMSNVNMTHFGSLVLVVAIHASGFRNTLSLFILKASSASIRWIYVNVFLVTLFFSMFLNSCIAAFLMVKVVDDILEEMKLEVGSGTLGDERMTIVDNLVEVAEQIVETDENNDRNQTQEQQPNETGKMEGAEGVDAAIPIPENVPEFETKKSAHDHSEREDFIDSVNQFDHENDQRLRGYGGELLYAVAVAANIGGTFLPYSSPVGDSLFSLEYVKFKNGKRIDTFSWSEASWVCYSTPLVLINSAICLTFLVVLNFGEGDFSRKIRRCLKIKENRLCMAQQSRLVLNELHRLFTEKYAEHRRRGVNFQEIGTIVILILYVLLQLTRMPLFIPGWSQLMKSVKKNNKNHKTEYGPVDVRDSVILIMIVLVIFFSPKSGMNIFKGPRSFSDKPRVGGFIGWKSLQSKFPWSILLLLAGSRCIGKFSKETIAGPIASVVLKNIPTNRSCCIRLALMGITCLFNLFLPNPGTTLVVQNIWNKMLLKGMKKELAPLLMSILSVCSLTFIIPSSSVPNAIVFRSRYDKKLSPYYFLKVGLPLFILTIIPTTLYVLSWSPRGLTFV